MDKSDFIDAQATTRPITEPPSLQDVIAAKYRHLELHEPDRRKRDDLAHNFYRFGARLSIAQNFGDQYSALMSAHSAIEAALSEIADRIRQSA